MDELKRNGSGYYDETAYKAMKNYERKNTMKAGEIWEVEIKGKISEMLIVKEQNSFCNVLNLFDDKLYENSIEVITTEIKYINPAMMQYAFNNRFTRKIMKMNDAEFESIIDKVYESLGITVDDGGYEEAAIELANELKLQIDEEKAHCEKEKALADSLKKELFEVVQERDELKKRVKESECTPKLDTIKLEAERDLYKRLYEQTLERLIAS